MQASLKPWWSMLRISITAAHKCCYRISAKMMLLHAEPATFAARLSNKRIKLLKPIYDTNTDCPIIGITDDTRPMHAIH